MRNLILASTSRYRRELLARLGVPFEVIRPTADERSVPGETPAEMAARLALAKARSIANDDAVIVGSDQVASLEGRLLRKPGGPEVAVKQLLACQGKTVAFDTAVVVLDSATGSLQRYMDRTQVQFRKRSRAELERYVRLEQPYDCAGSFKAEGLGVALFERIESSDPTALIGLPLIWLAHALESVGFDPLRAPAS